MCVGHQWCVDTPEGGSGTIRAKREGGEVEKEDD